MADDTRAAIVIRALFVAVLLYAGGFRMLVLTRPFYYGAEGSSSAFNGVLARNYLRLAFRETLGMPALTIHHASGIPLVFYRDHPPLIPLSILPSYWAFGVGEWQTRLPTALVTLIAIVVFYLTVKHDATPRIALIAAALFAAAPMTLYFGGTPEVVGIPLLLGVLLTVFAYLHFHRHPAPGSFLALSAALSIAAATDWPAFIIVPVLVAHFTVTRRDGRRWIYAFAAFAVLLFASLYIYIAVASGARWSWMVPLLIRRQTTFSWGDWFIAVLRLNVASHTTPLLLASGIWLLTFGMQIRRSGPGAQVARILLAWGILHLFLGAKRVYDHEWWSSPLTPAVAVSAALLTDTILRRLEQRVSRNFAHASAVFAVVAFALWTAHATYARFQREQQMWPVTPLDLGKAIRLAAPDPSDVALIVTNDSDAQLWFYGDRDLRLGVWTIADVTRRINDNRVNVVFDFDEQQSNAIAAGLVFPAEHRGRFNQLWTYLHQRYRLVPLQSEPSDKVDVFDLRH